MFRNRKAKLFNVLFVGIFLLPLVGLLMMDHELKRANDITGEYVLENDSHEYSQGAAAVVFFVLALVAAVSFIASRIRHTRKISEPSLAQVNSEIDELEKKFNDI